MVKVKRLPFTPLKRTALRKARRRIAAGAVPVGTREFTSTLTRVIPLADEVSDSVWQVAREAALTLRGIGPGSLFELVVDAHAAGWRFFASGKEREAFHLKRLFDPAAFNASLRALLGDELPLLSAESLRAVLGAPPRKVGRTTSVEVLSERLARAAGVKKADLASPPALITALAQALHASFATWSDLKVVDGEVGKVIDVVLADAGFTGPSLSRGWSQSLPVSNVKVGVPTIAFDERAGQIEEGTISARFAGVVARYLREVGDGDDPSKVVQSCVTTPNGNALSWLFGVGRKSFRSLSIEDLCAGLQVSSARGEAAVTSLREAMLKLPALSTLGDRAYPDARATLQGTADSLIANYVKRLVALQADARKIADTAVVPAVVAQRASEYGDVFLGMPFTADDLLALQAATFAEVETLTAALDTLMGHGSPAPGGYRTAIDAVDAFGAWVMRYNGVVGQVNARIKTLELPEALLLQPLFGGERWKSLVGLHDPEGRPVDVIPQLDAQLQDLVSRGDHAFDVMRSRYTLDFDKTLTGLRAEVRTAFELAARKGHGAQASEEGIELAARRKGLDAVARLVRRGAPSLAHALLAECLRQGLIRAGTGSERSLRGHLLSGEQEIYAHPLSRRRKLVWLEADGLRRLDIRSLLEVLESDAVSRRDVREQLLIAMARQALLLIGLPDRVEADAIRWEVPPQIANAPWADLRPINGECARSEVIKAFNAAFIVPTSGLLYRLNRQRFMERYDIRCFVGPTLLFAPKDQLWKPPAQYRVGAYGKWLNHAECPWDDTRERLNAVALARWLVKQAPLSNAEMQHSARALIAQLPHDWVVCCDFEGAPPYEGVFASDGTVSPWTRRTGYRLAPQRHFAGALLEGFKTASISPHGLTFELMLERDGLNVAQTSRRVTAAIPIAQPVAPAEQRWAPRFAMGLDLGEAGLGVCLKHLESGAEQTLLLRTRKAFKLARSEEHYRRRQQPRQTFRKQYNESPENAIKAAIGEVCGLIDNLIAKYDAVPVFESQAAAARGSNKMIARVYAGVLQKYTYVANNQAAQATRQSHWLGAGRWTFGLGADVLPAARQQTADELAAVRSPDAVFRDATGTPGVLVSGFRTSLICAQCGEDPLQLIDAAASAGQVAFVTDSEGVGTLEVADRKVRLRVEAPSQSPAVQRQARQRKRRSPWEACVDQTWTLTRKRDREALARTIRFGLRRAPVSIQTKGSSQWEFHCPCCQHIEQADVNAATNLVRRYVDRARAAAHARAGWLDPAVRTQFAPSVARKRVDSEAVAA